MELRRKIFAPSPPHSATPWDSRLKARVFHAEIRLREQRKHSSFHKYYQKKGDPLRETATRHFQYVTTE